MSPEAFELLPDQNKGEIRSKGQQLERRTDEAFLGARRIEREGAERVRALARDTAMAVVGPSLEMLRTKWAAELEVGRQLDAIQNDLLEHTEEFQPGGSRPDAPTALPAQAPAYARYGANVVVTHDPSGGPPVVFEPNPTYYNLLGRIDYRAAVGAMYTDFTLISPGALHRANGGFLVLQARDVLMNAYAWDVLKRSLRDQEIRIENLGEQLSPAPTASLKPSPIPLDVKVVLIGDLTTYTLLRQLDEDFRKLFKIKAEFSPTVERTAAAIDAYAGFIAIQVRSCGLLPFTREAVALVIEHAARLAEHQGRLDAHFGKLADVLTEATHEAREENADRVRDEHVRAALANRDHRLGRVEEEVQRLIDERTIAIATSGQAIGQVNGLSVLDTGDYVFARPSRITARVGIGADGVVNIEREVQLSGPSHSKGVMILSGYLLGAYARNHPLALSARLTFEQVYSEVDGDSASSAELYALLSALAEVPIDQGIAVTGSVDQIGEVQAVGGITAKIEGFFAVCKAQGLTGAQGVLIPQANVLHLMLSDEVVAAVEGGQFHVWAIRTIDEGVEILTGRYAGKRQEAGPYEEGSVHALVQERLAGNARRLARFGPRSPALGRER
jgi:lon-related putative ATP-dependent protease